MGDGDGTARQAVTQRGLWPAVGVIILFNSALVAWLLLKPGSPTLFRAVDDLAQGIGPLLMVPFCFPGLFSFRRRGGWAGIRAVAANRGGWAPTLLGLAVVTDALAQLIWAYYEQVLHQPAFPSWADAAYLSVYPLLLFGVLLLPRRPLPRATRVRVVMDGLMIMTAVAAFSWYVVLGPTLLQSADSALARVVGTAYPLFDLLLVSCLLLLLARSGDATLRPIVLLLAAALGLYVAVDTAFDIQNLQGIYATGELLDVGWPLADMLIALAAYALLISSARQPRQGGVELSHEAVQAEASAAPRLWRALLPYAFVPAVGALLAYACLNRGGAALAPGVFVAASVLVGLVLLRQVIAIKAANSANQELRIVQNELQARNEGLAAANARLQALATTDPLTGLPNHRALVAALDRELERAQSYGRPCTVLFIDIDHFKALNDAFGHAVGDGVLREFGALLHASLRAVDVVGRWGGEEFVAILLETMAEEALAAAERLRVAVAAQGFASSRGAQITCSVGLATYPHDAADRAALLDAADRAMYAAKRLGRNQVRVVRDLGAAELRDDAAAQTAPTALPAHDLAVVPAHDLAVVPAHDLAVVPVRVPGAAESVEPVVDPHQTTAVAPDQGTAHQAGAA